MVKNRFVVNLKKFKVSTSLCKIESIFVTNKINDGFFLEIHRQENLKKKLNKLQCVQNSKMNIFNFSQQRFDTNFLLLVDIYH
jgi:hypothetical protein